MVLIQISYQRGDTTENKYVTSVMELRDFVESFLDVYITDVETLGIAFYRGEREKQIKKGLVIEQ